MRLVVVVGLKGGGLVGAAKKEGEEDGQKRSDLRRVTCMRTCTRSLPQTRCCPAHSTTGPPPPASQRLDPALTRTHLLLSRAHSTTCFRRRSAYLELPMMPCLGAVTR